MGKIHEVLSVEPDLTGTAKKIVKEAKATFQKKSSHFNGMRKKYEPEFDDGIQYPDESKELVDTVPEKLEYVNEHLARAIDIVCTKEVSNMKTEAVLEIDGHEFGKFPSTALLALEKFMVDFRDLIESVPTLDPAERWDKDSQRAYVFITQPKKTLKTEKVEESLVLYDATDKHPAQTKAITKDKVVGKWEIVQESGMISPLEKSQMLGRVDSIIRAIKRARQRANDIEATQVDVGKALLQYVVANNL